MPKYVENDAASLAAVFHALGDPHRLAIVERLGVGPAATSELARSREMTLPSMLQHLGVLEAVGIVSSHKAGRVRSYQLVPGALAPAGTWIARHRSHWEQRLDQLDAWLIAGSPTHLTPPETETHS